MYVSQSFLPWNYEQLQPTAFGQLQKRIRRSYKYCRSHFRRDFNLISGYNIVAHFFPMILKNGEAGCC